MSLTPGHLYIESETALRPPAAPFWDDHELSVSYDDPAPRPAHAKPPVLDSDMMALTAINAQLGNARNLVGMAVAALSGISETLAEAGGVLARIEQAAPDTVDRAAQMRTFKSLVSRIADEVDGSSFKGRTLLGSASGAVPGTSRSVIRDEDGATRMLAAEDCSRLPDAVASLIGCSFARDAAGQDRFGPRESVAEPALRRFEDLQGEVASQLSQVGRDCAFLDETITLNCTKIERINGGLGTLVDADLSKEAARLHALVIRQQLRSQSLPLANHAPNALLSLFR